MFLSCIIFLAGEKYVFSSAVRMGIHEIHWANMLTLVTAINKSTYHLPIRKTTHLDKTEFHRVRKRKFALF